MEPAVTSKYLTENKIKGVKYRDVYSFVIPAVKKTNNFTIQLANGIVNAKRLIMIPYFLPSDSTGADKNMIFEPLSPFDSAPATTAPMAELGQFQVLISNMNVFQRAIDYSFEHFMEEISPANAINGGLGTGLTSGLIDYHKWVNNYRYYVVDLSRRLAGDNTPKSITILGTNKSLFTVQYYVFIEYERHLEIDVETGHVNVSSN